MLNEWQLQEHSTDPLGSSVASAVAVEHQRTNIELKVRQVGPVFLNCVISQHTLHSLGCRGAT